jgi:hypothetical protein
MEKAALLININRTNSGTDHLTPGPEYKVAQNQTHAYYVFSMQTSLIMGDPILLPPNLPLKTSSAHCHPFFDATNNSRVHRPVPGIASGPWQLNWCNLIQ